MTLTHDCSEWMIGGVCALCGQQDDAAIAQAIAHEIWSKTPAPMELVLRPHTVFALVALLQLATRHPGPTDDIRAAADRFIAAAREYFADCPTVLEVIRRGDDPAEDQANDQKLTAGDLVIAAAIPLLNAAPDLLDALKDAAQIAGDYYAMFHDEKWGDRRARWGAAIAKAEGR